MQNLVIKYAFFALLATVANLSAQRFVLSLDSGPMTFAIALGVGTGVGLFIKYLLDSLWIFNQFEANLKKNARRFALYTVTGILTTGIFWATEIVCWYAIGTHAAREAGAIAGLAIGYVVKYSLDRRFVFTELPLKTKEQT